MSAKACLDQFDNRLERTPTNSLNAWQIGLQKLLYNIKAAVL
jgi:hypothetical protein